MYAICFDPTKNTASAVSSESRDILQSYVDKLPSHFIAAAFATADEIGLNGPSLVKVYNAIAAANITVMPVNKFQSLDVAKRRVFDLVVKVAQPIAALKGDALIEAAADAMKRKNARNHQTAIRKNAIAKKVAATDKRPGDVGFRKKCDDYPMTAVITVLVEKNPKRPGSVSETRFACYRTGQTVEDYLRAGGRGLDVKWDVEHGFISVAVPDRG